MTHALEVIERKMREQAERWRKRGALLVEPQRVAYDCAANELDTLADRLAQARQEEQQRAEGLEADAARYRWLRDLKCNHFTVGHNEGPAPNYQTAADWIDEDPFGAFDDTPPEEIARMKTENSIWTVQVYPKTPIGFWQVHRSTLDAAIDAAIEGQG